MSSITQKIEDRLAPALSDLGYAIVRVSLFGPLRHRTLQVMIEKNNGEPVTIDDCEIASREASVLLDVMDPIKKHYNLEMSSTGINRPLVKPKDFARFLGHDILIKTFVSKNGAKSFKGKLSDANEKGVTLRIEGGSETIVEFLYEEISHAQLDEQIGF